VSVDDSAPPLFFNLWLIRDSPLKKYICTLPKSMQLCFCCLFHLKHWTSACWLQPTLYLNQLELIMYAIIFSDFIYIFMCRFLTNFLKSTKSDLWAVVSWVFPQ
jgi:hypothetical protein